MERYRSIIDVSKLPDSMKETLKSRDPCTLDELDEAYAELIYLLRHEAYYDAIDRYEKGTALLEQEQRAAVQAKYRVRLAELANEIERLRPKGEAV